MLHSSRFRSLAAAAAGSLLPLALAAQTPSFGEARLSTGVTLHYAEQGDPAGETIVLLHGYSDSWFSYSPILPLLPSSYHVFSLSQRGHGESDQPAGGYAMRDLAADVVAFLDAKGISRATVVGHSMGSLVAQRVALAAPDRVERLVLIGSGTSIAKIDGFEEFREAIFMLADPVPEEFARAFQESTIYHPVPAAFVDRAVKESLRLPARVWHALMEGMIATPRLEEGVRVPTLILWGERDTVFPGSEQDALLSVIPGATLKVYPETGHALHWERPEAFVRDLVRFIRDTSPGTH